MQHLCSLVLLLSLLVPAASVSAVSQARLFLRSHVSTPPGNDELAELKGANPEAYAIVKALLTKRSLGLLDPRHPSPSFTHAGEQHIDAADQGPEAFAKLETPAELQSTHRDTQAPKVAVPYDDVQPAAHQDNWNWKPQASALDDDTMVQNVLGAVADLKGKKANLLSKRSSSEESTPPTISRENSYLKTVDFGLGKMSLDTPAAAPTVPAKHKNSYLDGMDLSGDMPAVTASAQKPSQAEPQAKDASANYLAAFSWDDSQPRKQEHHKHTAPKVSGKEAKLLSWLGVESQEPEAAPVVPAKPSNPYIADLD